MNSEDEDNAEMKRGDGRSTKARKMSGGTLGASGVPKVASTKEGQRPVG